MELSARDWLDELVHLDRDPRTSQWWSTGYIAVPMALVLYTVAATIVPMVTSERKKRLPISAVVLPYNAIMCASHALVGAMLFIAYQGSGRSFICQDRSFEMNAASSSILNLMWLYLVLKVLSMFDALILLSALKEKRVTNAVVLNGFLSVPTVWWFLRYGADGHGVLGVVVLCLVDALTYSYYLCSMLGPNVTSVVRPHRVNVSRLQLAGTAVAWAHYFIALIAECANPSVLMLVGFAFVGLRFIRLFDFYTEKFVLNGMRLGIDWTIIAGMLENCCFAQGNPNGHEDDDEYATNVNPQTVTSAFRSGYSGPINKPKRG
ncbi:elongation of very long chain fatty acids protein 5-like [Tropilaelaps mercedesae]|uniref:Elongation of very long chain fatty acids protein n=1 Tax=Tropilaelaps mercedesae TaxID=418985 RepID=A0A1V9XZZ9_9ACAR|nr:elongation of very long chain fatty acids protein 5-like [Tropilaelaps mercedesae]